MLTPRARASVLLALALLVSSLVVQSSSTTRAPRARARAPMLFRSTIDGRIVAWSTNGGVTWLEERPPAWRRRGPL